MRWKYQKSIYPDPLGKQDKKFSPMELILGTHSKIIEEEIYGIDISPGLHMFSLKARLDEGIHEYCIDKFSFFAKDINGGIVGLDPLSAKKNLEIFSGKVESALKNHPKRKQLIKIFLQLKKKNLEFIEEEIAQMHPQEEGKMEA